MEKNLDPYFTAYAKINLSWILGLNINPRTIMHLEENTEYNSEVGKDFLDHI